MNARYWMTHKRNQEDGWWEPCKATTPRAAKAEARRGLSKAYQDGALLIAEGDGVTEERRVIARLSMEGGQSARWIDMGC